MADEATGTAILHEQTLKELGLSEQPFVDGKKPHRYSDSVMQKNRASLEQHARFGESVHLMLGETGVGKTVLLSQLIKHCKGTIKPFVAKGSESFVADAFLAAVLNQLGGPECETMTELVESLGPEFAVLNEQKLSVVLAIDDAHLAPVEEVAELVNVMAEFTEEDNITARLLLTGEAKLKSNLESIAREFDGMAFDPSISMVPALTELQLRDYLSSRLNHAGHTDVFPFTEKALAKIHRDSAGLPARVNPIAAHYLNTVFANSAGSKAGGGLIAALGWPLVALGTAAVGLIVWGLSMFIGGDDNSNQVAGEKPPTIVANAPVEIKLVDDDQDTGTLTESRTDSRTDSNANNVAEDSAANQNLTTAQNGAELNNAIDNLASTDLQTAQTDSGSELIQPADEATDADASSASGQSLTDSDLSNTGDLTDQPLAAEGSATELAAEAASDVQQQDNAATVESTQSTNVLPSVSTSNEVQITDNAETAETATGTETVIATSENLSETTLPRLPATDSDDATGSNGTATAGEETGNEETVADNEVVDITKLTDSDALADPNSNGVAVPVPSDNADQTSQSAPVINRAVENERWVLFQEPTHFTVQLATSREREYIVELAQGLSESPVAIYPFRTTDSQNPVFGLLSGLYKTRSEAINAVDQMPEELKRFGVWIRPISDLQADIKRNQQ